MIPVVFCSWTFKHGNYNRYFIHNKILNSHYAYFNWTIPSCLVVRKCNIQDCSEMSYYNFCGQVEEEIIIDLCKDLKMPVL